MKPIIKNTQVLKDFMMQQSQELKEVISTYENNQKKLKKLAEKLQKKTKENLNLENWNTNSMLWLKSKS